MSDSATATKRQKKNWERVDTGGKSIEECIESMKDKVSFSCEMSGKKLCKCKHHTCFGCKHTTRTYKLGDVEVVEESGEHVCNDKTLEKRTRGLPKHVKEKTHAELLDKPNIKPKQLFEKIIIDETDKNLCTPMQVSTYLKGLNRNKVQSEAFYRNTVEGVKEWSKRHPSIENVDCTLDDDKILIAKLWVTPNKYQLVITTKNMLKLLSYGELVLCMDSAYKCLWNRWPVHIIGAMDKHHHFHPVGYMFCSNEDADSHTIFVQSLVNAYEKLFGSQPDVKCSLNDNCDAIFKAFSTVFPLVFMLNCFAHMIVRNLPKYACELHTFKIKEITDDLNKMGDLACKQDFERSLQLFREKYASEKDFLDAFEKEYLKEHKGHWNCAAVAPGTPRSNNGLEGYNRVFKHMVTDGEPMKAFDFLLSIETHIVATSRYVHDKCVHKIACYHTHMEENRKKDVRKMHMKAFNEEFYFAPIDDAIIVSAKKNRTNGCTTERVKSVHEHHLSSPEGENLNQFLDRCLSCWQLTRNADSPYGYDCSCPVYCLYSQCKHVIRYGVDQGIHEIPDGCDFRPLGRAGKRRRPKGSGDCCERCD